MTLYLYYFHSKAWGQVRFKNRVFSIIHDVLYKSWFFYFHALTKPSSPTVTTTCSSSKKQKDRTISSPWPPGRPTVFSRSKFHFWSAPLARKTSSKVCFLTGVSSLHTRTTSKATYSDDPLPIMAPAPSILGVMFAMYWHPRTSLRSPKSCVALPSARSSPKS